MAGGRPTEYKEEYNEQAFKLTLLGHTDEGLAQFFGVTEQTINNWKNKYDEFFESIKKGKDESDFEVVESLRKRAIGFEYDEVKREYQDIALDDQEAEDLPPTKLVKTTITRKYYPADVGAAFGWLHNRQRQRWKQKWDSERDKVGKLDITINGMIPLKNRKKDGK